MFNPARWPLRTKLLTSIVTLFVVIIAITKLWKGLNEALAATDVFETGCLDEITEALIQAA